MSTTSSQLNHIPSINYTNPTCHFHLTIADINPIPYASDLPQDINLF